MESKGNPGKRTFLFAGGGTGGHLLPGLVLAEALARRAGWEPLFVTGRRPVEDRVLAGIPWERIGLDLEGGALRALVRMPSASFRVRREFLRRPPAGVLVLGGRIGIPAAFLARALGRPLFLLEVNALPGKTTRFLAPLARRIFLGYPEAARFFRPGRSKVTGIPVRNGFFHLPPKEEAARDLGLPAGPGPVLLIMGGSMGARSLNETLPALLGRVRGDLPRGTRVIHVAGGERVESLREAWRRAGVPVKVFPFLRAMDLAFAAADLAVCRGGALTMGEAAAARLPALVIPYPWHRDRHQEANALPLVRAGGARILPQERLPAEGGRRIASLLGDPARLRAMREAMGRLSLAARPGILAEELLLEAGRPGR